VIQIPAAQVAATQRPATQRPATQRPAAQRPATQRPAAQRPAPVAASLPPAAPLADDDPLGLGGFNEQAIGTPLPQTSALPQARRPVRRRRSQIDWGPIVKIGLIVGGALAGVVLLGVVGVVAWSFLGQRSPNAAFETAVAALERKDWEGYFDCVTPDGRDKIAGSLLAAGVMVAKGGESLPNMPPQMLEKRDKIIAVLDDHGIDQEVRDSISVGPGLMGMMNPAGMDQHLSHIRNRSAFIGDMIVVMQEIGNREIPTPPLLDARLEDVTISGDTATGTVVAIEDGRETRSSIRFAKVGGSWKIDMDSMGH
jgi:hypothetical protein